MSMNYYPLCGYFIDMDQVIAKLSQTAQEEWNELDTNPADIHSDLYHTSIGKELNEIFEDGWDIIFVDDEADTAGSLYLQQNKYYMILDLVQLYELRPKTQLTKLQELGLQPQKDEFCAFG